MKSSIFIFFFLFTLLPTAKSDTLSEQGDIHKRVSIENMIDSIREFGAWRLNFIAPSDGKRLTMSMRIKEIESIPEASRTKNDAFELALLKKKTSIDVSALDRSIGYPYERFNLNISQLNEAMLRNTSPLEFYLFLSQLFSKDIPSYEIKFSNGSMVVFPKSASEFNSKDSMHLESVTPEKALDELQRMLEPHKINIVYVNVSTKDFLSTKKAVTISIQDQPLPIILTRFSEALGNNIVWTIRGEKGRQTLQFNTISPSRNNGDKR